MLYSRKFLVVILINLFFSNYYLYSQDSIKVDSLKLKLGVINSIEEKTNTLLSIAYEYRSIDYKKSLDYSLQAFQVSKNEEYREGVYRSAYYVGLYYWYIYDYENALDYATKYYNEAKTNGTKAEFANALKLLGGTYYSLGNYKKCVDYYFECLREYEELDDKKGIILTLNLIGQVYFNQKKYDETYKYLYRTLQIAKEINDTEAKSFCYTNIAAIFLEKDEYKDAKYYTEKAIALYRDNNENDLGVNYLNLGKVHLKMRNYDSTFLYIHKAIDIAEKLKDEQLIQRAYLDLSEYFMYINDPENSLKYVLKLQKRTPMPELRIDVYKQFRNIYKKINNYENAYKYLNLMYEIKDSLAINEKTHYISNFEIQYEYEKREREKEREQEIKEQRKNILIIVIAFVSVIVIIILIYIINKNKMKSENIRLEKLKVEAELEAKNKEMAANVIAVIDKNKVMTDISIKLLQLQKKAEKDETKESLRKISKELLKGRDKNIWKEFEIRMNQIHIDFSKNLLKDFPDLSPSEIRLCALLKLNLTSKEIAQLLNIQPKSIDMARYRLRKKLNINPDTEIFIFFSKY